MNVTERVIGESLVVKLCEQRLDHLIAADFRDRVLASAEGKRGRVVIDLSEVQFMDSSGLGAIVGVRKRLGWSVAIVLAGLKSPVYRVFELSRMTNIFTFYTNADSAMLHLEGRSSPKARAS